MFEEEARKLSDIEFLAQGTIYPDILESDGVKAHHNVGGLPEDLRFALVEPLKLLFKDEVRVVGKALGLPDEMVFRQPFPGPGLGVRCLGAITRDRLEAVLRESDAILREEFANERSWRIRSGSTSPSYPISVRVGVKDGARTYAYPVILRAVNTVDAMTATVERRPLRAAAAASPPASPHEVPGVNRVALRPHPQAAAPPSSGNENRGAGMRTAGRFSGRSAVGATAPPAAQRQRTSSGLCADGKAGMRTAGRFSGRSAVGATAPPAAQRQRTSSGLCADGKAGMRTAGRFSGRSAVGAMAPPAAQRQRTSFGLCANYGTSAT